MSTYLRLVEIDIMSIIQAPIINSKAFDSASSTNAPAFVFGSAEYANKNIYNRRLISCHSFE